MGCGSSKSAGVIVAVDAPGQAPDDNMTSGEEKIASGYTDDAPTPNTDQDHDNKIPETEERSVQDTAHGTDYLPREDSGICSKTGSPIEKKKNGVTPGQTQPDSMPRRTAGHASFDIALDDPGADVKLPSRQKLPRLTKLDATRAETTRDDVVKKLKTHEERRQEELHKRQETLRKKQSRGDRLRAEVKASRETEARELQAEEEMKELDNLAKSTPDETEDILQAENRCEFEDADPVADFAADHDSEEDNPW